MSIKYVRRGLKTAFVVAATTLATVGAVRAQTVSGTVVFEDHDYSNADWLTLPGSLGLGFAGQVATGGNPGAYRQVQLNIGQNVPHVASLNTTFVYTPSTGGAVTGITYNMDLITTNAEGATYFALIQQDGVVYVDLTSGANATSNTWLNRNLVLDLADFRREDGQAGAPDFSVNGGAITFGYEVRSGGAGFFASITGIDNDPIVLTIDPITTPVPEPSTAALLACGVLVVFGLRRTTMRRDPP